MWKSVPKNKNRLGVLCFLEKAGRKRWHYKVDQNVGHRKHTGFCIGCARCKRAACPFDDFDKASIQRLYVYAIHASRDVGLSWVLSAFSTIVVFKVFGVVKHLEIANILCVRDRNHPERPLLRDFHQACERTAFVNM